MLNKSNKAIGILGFDIFRFGDNQLFIKRNTGEYEGEGTEVDEKKFSEHINAYYEENF